MPKSNHDHDQDTHKDADDIQLWGRDMEHEDFMEGHYGDDRHEPTPEGGQAGIAQGNTEARRRVKSAPTIRAHDRGDRGGAGHQD